MPFEAYHARKPRSILTNLVDLENAGKDLKETFGDEAGNQLTQINCSSRHPKRMAEERSLGNLQKEIRKRTASCTRFLVVKNKKNLASNFENAPRQLTSEFENTGKISFMRKMQRTFPTQLSRSLEVTINGATASDHKEKSINPKSRISHERPDYKQRQ